MQNNLSAKLDALAFLHDRAKEFWQQVYSEYVAMRPEDQDYFLQVLGRSETELVYMANYMSGQLNKISKAHEVLSELESL